MKKPKIKKIIYPKDIELPKSGQFIDGVHFIFEKDLSKQDDLIIAWHQKAKFAILSNNKNDFLEKGWVLLGDSEYSPP